MRYKVLQGALYSIILLSVGYISLRLLVDVCTIEIDEITVASYIVDGDTFETTSGATIRLADVDTPERGASGYDEASYVLQYFILDKRVYLDIDDVSITDSYGRLVCLVHIDYNSTHYLNVNKALLFAGVAEIWDHPNEFDPMKWPLYVPKIGTSGFIKLILISMGIGLVVTICIHFLFRAISRAMSALKSALKDRYLKLDQMMSCSI